MAARKRKRPAATVPPDPFNTLYLETSTLVREAWPRVSRSLERLLTVSQTLHLKILLPVPVELEHEQRWLRTWDELAASAKTGAKPLSRYLGGLSAESCAANIPDRDRILADYRRHVEDFKRTWSIEAVPITTRSIEELFRLAITHHLPFKEEGAGFQDAVIYFSVVDHVLRDNSRRGALIANDEVFSKPEVSKLTRSLGAKLVVHRTVEDTFEGLLNRVTASLRDVWHGQQRAAAAKLNEQAGDLKKHLMDHLDVSGVRLGFFTQPVGIARIELLPVEARDVQPPWPPVLVPGKTVTIPFSVKVNLLAIQERYPERPEPGTMRVGEERPTGLAAALPYMFPQPPERIEVPIQQVVNVEATATLLAREQFGNIEFGNVSLRA